MSKVKELYAKLLQYYDTDQDILDELIAAVRQECLDAAINISCRCPRPLMDTDGRIIGICQQCGQEFVKEHNKYRKEVADE